MTLAPPISVPYFAATPASAAPWPGVVVMPEGMGITTQLLRVCQRLGAAGFAALAPDVFWRWGGSDPDQTSDRYAALRTEDALDDVAGAITALRSQGAERIGITGFCMGGRLSYAAALAGLDLACAVPFYGGGIAGMLGEPTCPTLLFFGGRDEYIPPADIEAVVAHHPMATIVYPDAPHGFMRDGSEHYDEAAAGDAWGRLLTFLGRHLTS